MKNYNLQNYNTIKDLESDIITDINNDLADLSFDSTTYTDGEILEVYKIVELPNENFDFIVEVSVKGGIKALTLGVAFNNGLIKIDDKKDLVNEYISKLTKAERDRRAQIEEEVQIIHAQCEKENAIREAKLAAYKAKKLAEEEENKFQTKLIKATNKFEKDINKKIDFEIDTIDWLKDNVLSISATIPSHLEKAFIKVFGDQPHKVVDSRKQTSGGYAMKFAPTFSLRIKKDAISIPVELINKIKNNTLNDTSYIANLVRTYDFKFGKQS